MSDFSFYLFEGKYIFDRRIVKKLSLSFLACFNNLLASVIKQGHLGKFICRDVGFGIVSFAISV